MHTCEQLPRVVRARTKHSLDLVSQKGAAAFVYRFPCTVQSLNFEHPHKIVSKPKNYSLVDFSLSYCMRPTGVGSSFKFASYSTW